MEDELKAICTTTTRVAKSGDAAAGTYLFKKGEVDIKAYPEWAVRRMTELGYLEAASTDAPPVKDPDKGGKTKAEK